MSEQTPHHEEPSRSSLWQGFKNATRGTRNFLWEVAVPISTKKTFAAFLIGSQIGIPMATSLTMPSAEDLLRKDGLDSAIAQQLGANRTRILPTTFTGMTVQNTLTTVPGVAAGYALYKMILPPENRAAASQGFYFTPHRLLGMCTIILPDLEKYDLKNYLGIDSQIQMKRHGERATPFPVSPRETFWTVAFHEMAHCPQNIRFLSDHLIHEAEADVKAAVMAAEIFNNPEIPKLVLHRRAIGIGSNDHDTALYIDAALNGLPLPTAEEMYGAAEEIENYIADYHKRTTGEDMSILTLSQHFSVAALREALLIEGAGLELSPLARRRAHLHLQAVEYVTGKPYGVPERPAP